jgi:hypothetical protein
MGEVVQMTIHSDAELLKKITGSTSPDEDKIALEFVDDHGGDLLARSVMDQLSKARASRHLPALSHSSIETVTLPTPRLPFVRQPRPIPAIMPRSISSA